MRVMKWNIIQPMFFPYAWKAKSGPVLVHSSFALKSKECTISRLSSGWMAGLAHSFLSKPRKLVTISSHIQKAEDKEVTLEKPRSSHVSSKTGDKTHVYGICAMSQVLFSCMRGWACVPEGISSCLQQKRMPNLPGLKSVFVNTSTCVLSDHQVVTNLFL